MAKDQTNRYEYAFINGPVGPKKYGFRVDYFKSTRSFTNYNYVQVNGVYSDNVNLNYDWRLRLGLEADMEVKTSILQSFYSKIKLIQMTVQ
jgi:hypothetical protein